MTTVAVLGGGAGGAAACVELAGKGHDVRLWNARAATIEAFREAGGVRYSGVLGDGFTPVPVITTALEEALAGADMAMVCLPALAHERVATALAGAGCRVPVVLNPGHTCGALHAAAVFERSGAAAPPLAELSTLTYVARRGEGPEVRIAGLAGRVRAAALPGGEAALEAAAALYSGAAAEPDVLATSLANVNLVLHPPGAMLGLAWVEATGGAYRFYAEGTTPGVARVIAALDAERLAVAAAFGHALDPLASEMAAIGTVDDPSLPLDQAIARGRANSAIMAPDSLGHRYYREDFGYGVVPFVALAGLAGVDVPVARALLALAEAAVDGGVRADALTPERLGLGGATKDDLLARVRARTKESV